LKFGSQLSKDLREKYKTKSARPRVGDSVKILRGEFKNIEGKVTKVFPKDSLLNVEGVTREKLAGGNAPVPIRASNVVLTTLNMDDAERKKKMEAGQ
jgi:large subunit ribosomal protein L24